MGYFGPMPRKSPPPARSSVATLRALAHPPHDQAAPALPFTPTVVVASLDARLDFIPVPRGTKRLNGLTELKQRTFIQLHAGSGSVAMEAQAIGTTNSAMLSLRCFRSSSF